MAPTVGKSAAADVVHGSYDRMKELTEFDETKAGVKGLVDAGIKHVPRIFLHPPESLPKPSGCKADATLSVPVVDLQGVGDPICRREIVKEVGEACKSWGFFQVVNHGVPFRVLDGVIRGTRRFHEEDKEVKAKLYSRDGRKKVRYASNFDLFASPAANWRDTMFCYFDGALDDAEELPPVCRDEMVDYKWRVVAIADTLFELLSEALGLEPEHLKSMNSSEIQLMVAHYYPPCPEPHLTLGTTRHSDRSFATILLQDDLGGLQIHHQGRWVDIHPIGGALVVNIGDLLQLVSNDKFKSVEHRVLASDGGPRISVAMFFNPRNDEPRRYGPIKEVLSDENPAKYKEILVREFNEYYFMKGLDGESALNHFKL